jgi:hypothetical protein
MEMSGMINLHSFPFPINTAVGSRLTGKEYALGRGSANKQKIESKTDNRKKN